MVTKSEGLSVFFFWVNVIVIAYLVKGRMTIALWTEAAPIHAKFWILRCQFFFKNLFIIVLLSRVQRFNNLQNIFHVKKLLQSYISPYNSIKQNKNFISIYFHKMLYTARKIFLFCFQKYRSFLLDHIALGRYEK